METLKYLYKDDLAELIVSEFLNWFRKAGS